MSKSLEQGGNGDRTQRRLGHGVDLGEHRAHRALDPAPGPAAPQAGAAHGGADVFEQFNHVHKGQALGVARKAVAAAHAAHGFDHPCLRQRVQHLGEVVRRDAVLARDLAGRELALGVRGGLEHAVECKQGIFL
jgi:hypothetical protein